MTEPSSSDNLSDLLTAAEEAARKAAVVLDQWRPRFRVNEKAPTDLVTDADFASQETIRDFLLGQFPKHAFLGEEELPSDGGRTSLDLTAQAPPTWIVDPIDGTVNYVHDVPAYCIAIGCRIAGELRIGVTYDPRADEMFSAAEGLGATLNGNPIQVSQVPTLRESLLSTGFPSNIEAQLRNLEWWRAFAPRAQHLRRTGSTALNLAYIACGRFDGYWAFDNSAWDVASGVVLIREAGGNVTRVDGTTHNPFQPDILASNGTIHAEMLGVLSGENC